MVVRVGDSQGLGVLQEADQDGRHSSGNHVHHHVRHEKPHLQDEKKGEGEGGARAMAKICARGKRMASQDGGGCKNQTWGTGEVD